jgi:hypothetical protein
MSGCSKQVRTFIQMIDKLVAPRLNKGTINGAGKRLWPSRISKNDAKKNFRVDQGHVHDASGKVYDLILQANKETKSVAVQNFIKKYTCHAKVAKITIDCREGQVSDNEIKAGFLENFEKREREKDFS